MRLVDFRRAQLGAVGSRVGTVRNCAVLKPSQLAPRPAEIIGTLLRECFAEEYISAATGGANVTEALLRERFDKIFFIGSPRVGRLVMGAAAKHLTPVTLELDGKCPAIPCPGDPRTGGRAFRRRVRDRCGFTHGWRRVALRRIGRELDGRVFRARGLRGVLASARGVASGDLAGPAVSLSAPKNFACRTEAGDALSFRRLTLLQLPILSNH